MNREGSSLDEPRRRGLWPLPALCLLLFLATLVGIGPVRASGAWQLSGAGGQQKSATALGDAGQNDADARVGAKPGGMSALAPQALGDVLFTHDILSVTTPPMDIALGVEYALGYFWVSGRSQQDNVKKIVKLDSNGQFVAEYPQEACDSATFGYRDLAFDGTYLWAADECGVDKINPATGARVGGFASPDGQLVRGLAYDPASGYFYAANFRNPLIVFDATGQVIRSMANPGDISIYGLAWDSGSPGGPYLWAWWGSCQNCVDIHAWRLNPATAEYTNVGFDGVPVSDGSVQEVPGGATISDQLGANLTFIGMHQISGDSGDKIRGYDLAVTLYTPTATVTGTPPTATRTATPTITPTPTATADRSVNGRIVFERDVAANNSEIYTMNPDGTGLTRLTNRPGTDFLAEWSPDGTQIVFVSDRDEIQGEIYIMNADGSHIRRLTYNAYQDLQPAWSATNKIAFISNRTGNNEIYTMNLDGSGQTNITNNPADDTDPDWSPAGDRLVFVSLRDGGADLFVMNANGSNPTNVTHNAAFDADPAWAPGSRIAFTSTRDGDFDVYTMEPDGSDVRQVTNNPGRDTWLCWAPSRDMLAFSSPRDDGASDIFITNVAGTGQTNITHNPLIDIYPNWAPAVGSATATVTGTPPTATRTATPSSTTRPTSTITPIPFSDVHSGDYFYTPVQYLAGYGVISGYGDNTFRPYNNTTRGQLAKIIVLAESFPLSTTTTPSFVDVPTTHTFFQYIETAVGLGIINGYDLGGGQREFRPGNDVTRGQLAKIIVNAAWIHSGGGWPLLHPTTPSFSDVAADNPFYDFVETAVSHNFVSGYRDPDSGALQFRPGNPATRGQIAKIVYLAATTVSAGGK